MQVDHETVWQDIVAIRNQAPLVHNITNYVVMNSTANALLALGASPVMAHAMPEVAEMVAISRALVVNIGTLSPQWVTAMEKAMRHAVERWVPIVFDPVGAGATSYRTEVCSNLLAAVSPAVIRGNASEIKALAGEDAQTKGVDSVEAAGAALVAAQGVCSRYNCVVCVSGAEDIITDGQTIVRIHNGDPLMARITGLGCTASALLGAFVAVNSSSLLAASHAMALMGVAGEISAKRAAGPGTLQLHLYDVFHSISQEDIKQYLKVELG